MKTAIKVDSMGNFQFWLGMFKPRTKKWQKDNLKRLKNETSVDWDAERQDKIKALEFLLGN